MCLITKQTEPKIATEDMTVYKILTLAYISIFEHFNYKPGELYSTEIKEEPIRNYCYDQQDSNELVNLGWRPNNRGDFRNIAQGFHSVTTKERLKDNLKDLDTCMPLHYNIFKCTIPKGSEYYLDRGLVVSNQIIIH